VNNNLVYGNETNHNATNKLAIQYKTGVVAERKQIKTPAPIPIADVTNQINLVLFGMAVYNKDKKLKQKTPNKVKKIHPPCVHDHE